MKREEKNQLTKRRIINGALKEFSQNGYRGGSINSICVIENVSKGIIYHYFESKDELFLTCVEECFDKLTSYINKKTVLVKGEVNKHLEEYFKLRSEFFRSNPIYQKIFCEAIINPPKQLKGKIQEKMKNFEELNIKLLSFLLDQLELNKHFSRAEIIDTFRQFQDFINSKYQISDLTSEEFDKHERMCLKVLNILLYGVVDK